MKENSEINNNNIHEEDNNLSKSIKKIVYFDEESATDYLAIQQGGVTEETMKELIDKEKEAKGVIKTNIFTKIPLIIGAINGSAEGSIEHSKSNILEKTITNTLLNEFLKEVNNDNLNIKTLKDRLVMPYHNSFTYFKIFTPFFKMISNDFQTEDLTLKISKMDEALEKGKGYYEMIATSKNSQNQNDDLNNVPERVILRFNISSFRNNYTLSDLTQMDLKYYVVKVGEIKEKSLDITTEIGIETIITDSSDLKESNDISDNKLDVYDVFLAGVSIDD